MSTSQLLALNWNKSWHNWLETTKKPTKNWGYVFKFAIITICRSVILFPNLQIPFQICNSISWFAITHCFQSCNSLYNYCFQIRNFCFQTCDNRYQFCNFYFQVYNFGFLICYFCFQICYFCFQICYICFQICNSISWFAITYCFQSCNSLQLQFPNSQFLFPNLR